MEITVKFYNYNNDRRSYMTEDWFEASSAEDVAKEAVRLIDWIKSGQAEEEDDINDFSFYADDEELYEMGYSDSFEDIVSEVNEAASDIADDIIRELRDELIDEQEYRMTNCQTADIEALKERGIIKLDDNGDYIDAFGFRFDFRDFAEDFVDLALSDDGGRLHDLFDIEDYSGAHYIAEDIISSGYDDYFDIVAGRHPWFPD